MDEGQFTIADRNVSLTVLPMLAEWPQIPDDFSCVAPEHHLQGHEWYLNSETDTKTRQGEIAGPFSSTCLEAESCEKTGANYTDDGAQNDVGNL